MRVPIEGLVVVTMGLGLLQDAWSASASVTSRDGNIHYTHPSGKSLRLTDSGRDQEPSLQPGGEWVYFIRTFEGAFSGGKYRPPPGKTVPPGTLLQEEVWRVRKDGSDARMLYRHEAGMPSEDDDHDIASISNIQFSPDGKKVYFEASRWATSSELWMMNADGSGQVALSPGNGTRIIQSSKSGEYRGYILTSLHRHFVFGGSYDWFHIFTPDMKKEIGPAGESLEEVVSAGGLTLVPTGRTGKDQGDR
ncbi:MAG: hypothetical protein FJ280_18410 [Planctomycetes bacterium]|nr:hypothetical protein [Planctomycetota bacterium]